MAEPMTYAIPRKFHGIVREEYHLYEELHTRWICVRNRFQESVRAGDESLAVIEQVNLREAVAAYGDQRAKLGKMLAGILNCGRELEAGFNFDDDDMTVTTTGREPAPKVYAVFRG